jgi:hypothetical protein
VTAELWGHTSTDVRKNMPALPDHVVLSTGFKMPTGVLDRHVSKQYTYSCRYLARAADDEVTIAFRKIVLETMFRVVSDSILSCVRLAI